VAGERAGAASDCTHSYFTESESVCSEESTRMCDVVCNLPRAYHHLVSADEKARSAEKESSEVKCVL
jgi:hypothetical protein